MSSNSESAALDVRDARKSFGCGGPNERVALDGVSLRVEPGDFVTIIGSNGAGKSTLLNTVAGEIALDAGRVAIAGADVTAEPVFRRAKKVARVFQDPLLGTAAGMSVEENMALAARRGRRNTFRLGLSSAGRERFREQLSRLRLGLEDRLDQHVDLLSGGQRQSLSLAMAVSANPILLLLDEHTAALDPRTADLVMQASVRAIADNGISALMVTHNMEHAISAGNRLVMMRAGRIIFEARDAEKAALTVPALVERFHLASDRMVLA